MPEVEGARAEALPNDFSTLGITHFTHNVALETLKDFSRLPELPKRELRSSPQDDVVPHTIIKGPAAWLGSKIQQTPEQYIYYVNTRDVEELDSAVARVEKAGVSTAEQIQALTKDDFPLPTFGPILRKLVVTGVHRRGFQMLRGIPVEKYSQWQLVVLWWGIGQHVGRVLPINRYGHLINHIHSLDNNSQGKRTRAPNTNQPQNMHSDQFATDIIGLFAISKAKQGGESTFVSSYTIHNELIKRGRTDLLEALTQRNFWLNRTGYDDGKTGFRDPETGEARYFPVASDIIDNFSTMYHNRGVCSDAAPFVYHDGRLSVAFQSTGYYSTQEEPEVPRLTDLQLEALRTVQALAIDPQLSIHFLLQPGDIQLLHNTTVLHGREGFTDGELPHEKRHLLRWWIDASGVPPEELRKSKPLACFGDRLRDPAGGWPFAKTPYSLVLNTDSADDASVVKFL